MEAAGLPVDDVAHNAAIRALGRAGRLVTDRYLPRKVVAQHYVNTFVLCAAGALLSASRIGACLSKYTSIQRCLKQG
jgi:hypothetical protein